MTCLRIAAVIALLTLNVSAQPQDFRVSDRQPFIEVQELHDLVANVQGDPIKMGGIPLHRAIHSITDAIIELDKRLVRIEQENKAK